jgi:hypothetical protein
MWNVVQRLYKGDGFLLNIYVCYSWAIELNISFDISFHNIATCLLLRD